MTFYQNETKASNRTIVEIRLISVERSPEELVKRVGLEADQIWRIGDVRQHTIITERDGGCVWRSRLPGDASLSHQLEAVLARVAPVSDRIRALSETDDVQLSCVIYASCPPALNFDKSVMRRIAELGASLDIDLYILDRD